MAGFSMEFSQNQQLTQQMHLSPQMLQSVNFLMMNHMELTANLYDEVQKNPALEIVRDAQLGISTVYQRERRRDLESASFSKASPDASTNFQQFLESQPDQNMGIQQHLWQQYQLVTSNPTKLSLAERVISMLNFRGFTQVAPISLLDENNPQETPQILKQVLTEIQNLEPVGCGTSCSQESLYVQARFRCDCEPWENSLLGKEVLAVALFLLAGNLFLLEKLRIPVMVKKLKELQQADTEDQEPPETTKGWNCSPQHHQLPKKITESTLEAAISFIKTLDPLPARQFSPVQGSYIYPEITVEQYQDGGETGLKVILNHRLLPEIILSPSFTKAKENGAQLPKDKQQFIKNSLKSAQGVLQSLNFRKDTLKKAAYALVELQRDFFLFGPRFLRPLKMKDMAEIIQVHETTISRLANEKYLRCQWGIFEIKYFFSNQVKSIQTGQSKESVKFLLKEILEEQAHKGQSLSDQKLADLLTQRGIKIARRTVTKYRQELNINSSFDRK